MLLSAPVVAAPTGAPAAPLGTVLAADNAHAGVNTVYAGATVYDGDRFATQDDGTMRLRLGTGQLVLHEGTSIKAHAFPNGFSADLDNGTVSASSLEGQTFQLLVNGITIRPAGSHPTAAQIARVSSTEAILISTRGDLQVTLDDEVKTVSAGASYKLEVESPDNSSSSDQKQKGPIAPGRNRHGLLIIVIAAAAIGAGFGMFRALQSPMAP